MRIRFLGREDGGIPVISRKIVDRNTGIDVETEEEIRKVKSYLEDDVKFEYKNEDGEWEELTIDYFEEDEEEMETAEFTSDIEEVEEIDYEELFSGHWRTQTKKVKDAADGSVEILDDIIEYGEENDAADAVLERVKEYRQELAE